MTAYHDEDENLSAADASVRRQGHSRLVYDKETRTIVTVRSSEPTPRPQMTDRKKLREAAMKATMPWTEGSWRPQDQEANLDFIRACDPQTILSLLDDLDRPVGEVVVKPLEWDGNGVDRFRAGCVVGVYTIVHDGDEPDEWTLRLEDHCLASASSADALKAAAQDDFAEKIKFSLAPSPAIGRETDLLAEISERNMEEKRAEWAATALSSAQERIAELEEALDLALEWLPCVEGHLRGIPFKRDMDKIRRSRTTEKMDG